MIVFSIITFTLFWVTFRYNLLFVMVSHHDTRGRLYPTALNQLFTGIYIMELCLLGLFLLVRDEQRRFSCIGQAAVMVVATGLTVTFQILLNQAFAPLLRFLPLISADQRLECDKDPEIRTQLEETSQYNLKHERHGHDVYDHSSQNYREHHPYCQGAFQNEALRVQIPVVWIPKDVIGISDDELYHTRKSYAGISISNERTSMKSNGRVVVRGNPPNVSADFSANF